MPAKQLASLSAQPVFQLIAWHPQPCSSNQQAKASRSALHHGIAPGTATSCTGSCVVSASCAGSWVASLSVFLLTVGTNAQHIWNCKKQDTGYNLCPVSCSFIVSTYFRGNFVPIFYIFHQRRAESQSSLYYVLQFCTWENSLKERYKCLENTSSRFLCVRIHCFARSTYVQRRDKWPK